MVMYKSEKKAKLNHKVDTINDDECTPLPSVLTIQPTECESDRSTITSASVDEFWHEMAAVHSSAVVGWYHLPNICTVPYWLVKTLRHFEAKCSRCRGSALIVYFSSLRPTASPLLFISPALHTVDLPSFAAADLIFWSPSKPKEDLLD